MRGMRTISWGSAAGAPPSRRRSVVVLAVVAAVSVVALGIVGGPVPPSGAAPAGVAGPGSSLAPAAPGAPAQTVPANQAPTSAVALAANPDGFDHAFYRGLDGAVYQRTFTNGVWSAQTSIGGGIVGAPSAALADTTLVVAARGRNGALYVRMATQGVWGAWRNLGGVLSAAPAVVGGADGRIDVFVRGNDYALWTRSLPPGGTWSGWSSLGGNLASGPAGFSSSPGAAEVYATAPDHAVWYRTRSGGAWSGWQTIGGGTYTAPAAAWSPQNGTASVFVRGVNNALYVRHRTGSAWGAWQRLGGILIDAPAAAGMAFGPSPAGLDVVIRGRDNALWSIRQRNGTWSGFARAWVPSARPGPAASLLGTDWTRIPTTSRVVALTFDAGANADAVASIRQTLHRENVPATFFLTGEWVRDFPASANEIAVGGFRIANHSDTHPMLTTLTDAQVRAEVQTAEQSILQTNGADTRPLFRFPFGNVDSRVLGLVNGMGYVGVRWTVDTLGWQGTSGGQSTTTVLNRALGALQPGEIVLMHVGSHPTDHSTLDADALPQMIDAMQAQGYSFVTLDALVGF